MLQSMVSRIARTILPDAYSPEVYLHELARERTGMVVVGGCFAGLHLPSGARDSLVPKLLGIYERELAVVVEEIVRQGFDKIINVGAAEGYYAVGLGRRIPHAVVQAFETDADVRRLLSETAAANGMADRVVVKGRCEPADLSECLTLEGRELIVCDVEGYESVLMDPCLVPQLSQSSILVELHEPVYPGITALIRARFESSHRIAEIGQESRSASEFPYRTFYTRLLPDRFILNAISEWRDEEQSWFWMCPRSAPLPSRMAERSGAGGTP
jgi:hypothetical protein